MGAQIGATAATVRAIEGGANPDGYELGLLARYADALGCTIDDLFERDVPTPAAGDVERVVAALVDGGHAVHLDVLALALGWTSERCRDVLRAAGAELEAVGIAVAWNGDAGVALIPRADIDVPSDLIAQRTVGADGLNSPQARLLATLAIAGKLSRTSDQFAAGRLIAAGLVEYSAPKRASSHRSRGIRAQVGLTEQARFDLCLDE